MEKDPDITIPGYNKHVTSVFRGFTVTSTQLFPFPLSRGSGAERAFECMRFALIAPSLLRKRTRKTRWKLEIKHQNSLQKYPSQT